MNPTSPVIRLLCRLGNFCPRQYTVGRRGRDIPSGRIIENPKIGDRHLDIVLYELP